MKIIRFFAHKNVGDNGKPIPAKTALPEWYRLSEYEFPKHGEMAPGIKKCVPFLDGMLSGYMLTLPIDVEVTRDDKGFLDIKWDSTEEFANFIIKRDSKQGEKIPRPAGHLKDHLAFHGKWGWKTPRGYSTLVVQPLNRFDLPFTILSGIIDSDEFSSPGNLPFFIREDFQGVIPKGTPIAQIIPVKRDSWALVENDASLIPLGMAQGEFVRSKNKSYKKNMWHRKEYK